MRLANQYLHQSVPHQAIVVPVSCAWRHHPLPRPPPSLSPILPARPPSLSLTRATDYAANASDAPLFRRKSSTHLSAEEVKDALGYARDFVKQYTLGEILGCGSFGVVRECTEIATGQRFAVKTLGKIPDSGATSPRHLLRIRSEVESMQQLGYSLDAVNLKATFEDDTCVYLVMELCTGGELLDRIKASRYSEKYIASLVRSMLRFIAQCHAKGFIYRDIKPENFLFLNTEPNSPLKATDFGLSIRHTPDEPKLKACSGTPAYMAPELVRQNYDAKCDVWSVGMLSYQLLTGRLPFWHDVGEVSVNDVFKDIVKADFNWRAQELAHLSPSAVDFLKKLLTPNSSRRPSAAAALDHPWVRERGEASDVILDGSVVQRLQRFSTFSHLKQMVFKLVFEEMRREREQQGASSQREQFIEIVQEMFETMDSDGSGGISMEELQEGLKKQGYELSESEALMLGKKADHDKSSEIDFCEFMISLIDWTVVQKDRKWKVYLDRAFKKIDDDGNGYITLDELMVQLHNLGGGGSSTDDELMKEAKKMMREADTNGDGKISRREFDRMLLGCNAQDALYLYDNRLGPKKIV